MKARIHFLPVVLEAIQELSPADQERVFERLDMVEMFPRMYPVRGKGRFRQHRWFLAGDWIVYYRVTGKDVFVRGIWPARMP